MKKKKNKLQLFIPFLLISSVFITMCLANTENINLDDEVILIPEDSNLEPMDPSVSTTPQFIEKTIRVDFMEGINPKYELYANVTTKGDTGKIEIRDANTNKLIKTLNRP